MNKATQVLLIIAGILLAAFLICVFINRIIKRKQVVSADEDEKPKGGFCYFFIELIFGLFGGN
ncbi:MAG: hypothetical protein ACK5Z2_19485 [Bacteroidota bacterium]|jgi:hypothetical protein